MLSLKVIYVCINIVGVLKGVLELNLLTTKC